jgi:ubiquitin carboxyl-terminal hydrolase 14
MLRDAENAKFGLKAQGKASGFKENEVMVVLYSGYH